MIVKYINSPKFSPNIIIEYKIWKKQCFSKYRKIKFNIDKIIEENKTSSGRYLL